jgi:hypothetical protein
MGIRKGGKGGRLTPLDFQKHKNLENFDIFKACSTLFWKFSKFNFDNFMY